MMCARMLYDIFPERVVSRIARSVGRLGRLEAHVIPAEIFETIPDLAETLRPHGRASSALAGEKTGRERGERLGFAGHLAPPYWPTTRRPKPPTGRGLAAAAPGAAPGAANTVRRKFFSRRSEIYSQSSVTSFAERPWGSISMTVRPSIIEAAKSVVVKS